MKPLSILHVDMDAFYVEVERQIDPSLVGKPVVVGGRSDRGVVASASYEARALGVRSAMSSVVAKNLCPDAVFVKSNFSRYRKISKRVHEIFNAVTPLVEPIALDEAFLDIGGAHKLFGSSEEIAWQLRNDIYEEVGLDCSVGVASSKLLAKLASVAAKPIATPEGVKPGSGVFVVHAGIESSFLQNHPVEALWGVGSVTLKKLRSIGIKTVGDLAQTSEDEVVAALGASHGRHLHGLSKGLDGRAVNAQRERKSISHEETFEFDVFDRSSLESEIIRLADAVSTRARSQGLAGRTVQIKVRRPDMSFVTKFLTLEEPIDTLSEIADNATALLAELDLRGGVRLLGLGITKLGPPGPRQLTLDSLGERSPSSGSVSNALDNIREKFGQAAIGPGFPKKRAEIDES